MDTHCAICGEPWDIYGLSHGDVKAWEADAIRAGYGCPCCRQNGKEPTDKYVMPEPRVIAKCSHCETEVKIAQYDIWYNGKEIEYDESLVSRLPNNKIVCNDCKESLTQCDECGAFVDEENSVYIQELSACLCDSCHEQLISCCDKCGQCYWDAEGHEC